MEVYIMNYCNHSWLFYFKILMVPYYCLLFGSKSWSLISFLFLSLFPFWVIDKIQWICCKTYWGERRCHTRSWDRRFPWQTSRILVLYYWSAPGSTATWRPMVCYLFDISCICLTSFQSCNYTILFVLNIYPRCRCRNMRLWIQSALYKFFDHSLGREHFFP